MTRRALLLVRLPADLVACIDQAGERMAARALVRGIGFLLVDAADLLTPGAMVPPTGGGATSTVTLMTARPVASDCTGCDLDGGTSGGPT